MATYVRTVMKNRQILGVFVRGNARTTAIFVQGVVPENTQLRFTDERQ